MCFEFDISQTGKWRFKTRCKNETALSLLISLENFQLSSRLFWKLPTPWDLRHINLEMLGKYGKEGKKQQYAYFLLQEAISNIRQLCFSAFQHGENTVDKEVVQIESDYVTQKE